MRFNDVDHRLLHPQERFYGVPAFAGTTNQGFSSASS